MNKKLKFSWGHIVAFVAIIFVAFVSFIGLSFLTSGKFLLAGFGSLLVVLILLICFLGAQRLKATDCNFEKSIKKERILVFVTPFIFVVVMLPFTHFWTVHSHQDQVIGDFSKAVAMSENVFVEYEKYANVRINKYQSMLLDVVDHRDSNYRDYAACGFSDISSTKKSSQVFNSKPPAKKHSDNKTSQTNAYKPSKADSLMINTMVQTLKTQLLSHNYDILSSEARKWIASASKGTTTWNVFLIGNMRQIDTALSQWQRHLVSFADRKISNEEFGDKNKVEPFDNVSTTIAQARAKLHGVNDIYRDFKFPCLIAIILMAVVYAALFLPYYIQPRNTKVRFDFWGKNNSGESDIYDDERSSNNPNIKTDNVCELDFDNVSPSDEESDWTSITF
ncbi:MAG: hypothetical protein J6Y98_08455 [Bacteroidales bacterium]|nr:hypothetical protein [Bacteroidales bacterium]